MQIKKIKKDEINKFKQDKMKVANFHFKLKNGKYCNLNKEFP